MNLPSYTVIDSTGALIGFGVAHTRDFPEAYAWSCNNEPWEGKSDAALPFKVADCNPDGSLRRD
jgi:hypothetical protein